MNIYIKPYQSFIISRNILNKFKIKTSCGIDKFNKLREKQGLLNKIRLYWFIFFAVIRDYKK